MANVSGIYVIKNTKNGKVYIGQAQDFRKRWDHHKYRLNGGYHSNRHLQHAWNKYGEKAFKFQKLEYCAIEQLDNREQHYLDIYMPKGLCYNLARDVRAPGRGRIITEETRRKLSEANKSRNRSPFSEETRRKMSEAAKNKLPPSAETRRKLSEATKNRRSPSEETRRKISETLKGKILSEETRRKLSEAMKAYRARQRAEREALENLPPES